MKSSVRLSAALALLALGACTTIPEGPSVMALPGTGKSFDQFRADDYECRQYASSQLGTNPSGVQAETALKNAAVGTAVGALAGAAMGGHQGAGAGAGAGLIVGSVAGAEAGNQSGYSLQRRYDNAYVQCMYAKGDKVPVPGNLSSAPAAPPTHYSPPYPPPPPSGAPR